MKSFFCLLTLFFCSLFAKEENPIILVVGTRPDAIKMLPIYFALKEEGVKTLLCSTGQHAEMLDSVFDLFNAVPDKDFRIMKPNQDLFYITEQVLEKTKAYFTKVNPRMVVVHGDTTSAMASAMSAFYLHIPLVHIEAGLRSHNSKNPYPEEMNRRAISLMADYHFAPTPLAAEKLLYEGIDTKAVFTVGNTVVDAFMRVKKSNAPVSKELIDFVQQQNKQGSHLLLFTAHRRESLGENLENIFHALKSSLQSHKNLAIIYPSHPNPLIQKTIQKTSLNKTPRMHITSPLSYRDTIYLLEHVDGVITDSGGLQEEAVSLHKPTIVLREKSDRPEGTVSIVGTNRDKICNAITQVISGAHSVETSMPYGTGQASPRIAKQIKTLLKNSQ